MSNFFRLLHKIRNIRHILIVGWIIAGLSLAAVLPTYAQSSPEPPRRIPTGQIDSTKAEYVPGELLVLFKSGAPADASEQAQKAVNAEFLQNLYESRVQLWGVTAGGEAAAIDALNNDPNVEYAEPNYIVHTQDVSLIPNDPGYPNQWGHPKINSPAAWDLSTGSASITIAIIDTGIDLDHPDLASKIVAGYDFIDGDTTPNDLNNHGTHVAGIAGALGNNSTGGVGVDWQARLMPVRVLDANGSGSSSGVANGINWAYQHGAKVLNLSLGGPDNSQTVQNAVTDAWNAGSLVLAAMGNAGTSTPLYPAANANVMAVAATTSTDQRASFSSYGSHCDIAAPGENIYSTVINGYDYFNGTSMATPFVSGLAALLWSVAPGLTNAQVQQTIQNNAVDLGTPGWDSSFGYGRINALETLNDYSYPSAPNLLAISNGDLNGDYLVDWDSVSTATSYSLQEDDNPAFSSPNERYNGANTQFQIMGQPGGTWYYRVRGSNGSGAGPWSNTQSTTVLPSAPTLNAISNPTNLDHYQVSWGAVSGGTSYTLEEDDSNAFLSPEVRFSGSSTTMNITGQTGGTWYYRVRAANSAGNGPWSNIQSTSVNGSGVSAPSLSAIVNSDNDGAYLVDWSDVGGATQYLLEQSLSIYFDSPTQVFNGSASQHQVTNQSGGTWYYRVRAVTPSGQSPWSNKQSVHVNSSIFVPMVFTKPATVGLPIQEGFESAIMPPTGWTRVQSNSNETWGIGTNPYTGSYNADILYDASLGQQNEVLISPSFQASGGAVLQFYSFGSLTWCRDTYNNCDLKVWVVFGDWGGSDDVHIYTADQDWPSHFLIWT